MSFLRSPLLLILLPALFIQILTTDPAYGQEVPDPSTAFPSTSNVPANHSPEGALYRSLAVPGWGQVYNRQYWKLPFVYAALGSITWVSIQASQNHKLYTRAYQYIAWEQAGEPRPELENSYLKVLQIQCGDQECTPQPGSLKQLRDNFRRNRDLSRFGIGLVYGLTVIDAFVSAHLIDFDVSEDLTLRVYPHPNGATAQLRIGF